MWLHLYACVDFGLLCVLTFDLGEARIGARVFFFLALLGTELSGLLFRIGTLLDFYHGEDRRGLADNVYTLCHSEVVSPGRDYAALVGFTAHRSMGSFSDVATSFPVRDYVTEAGLCFCVVGYPLLVRDLDAQVVCLAGT